MATKAEALHVAILAYCLEGGGVQRQTLTLGGEMAVRGHKVDYIVVRAVGELVTKVPAGVNLVELVPSGGRRNLGLGSKTLNQIRALPKLVEYLRQHQPDALLSGGTHANFLAIMGHLWARTGNRLVLRITSHMSRNNGKTRFLPRLAPLVARFLYPVADDVVTVSYDVRDDFLRTSGFDPVRVRMIREPVITPAIHILALEPVTHPWFKKGEPPVILAVGRLSPEKDFETLIRAFAEVRRARPARLLVLGAEINAGYATGLRKLAEELGVTESLDLAGYSSNPYAFMSHAKVFALSSLYEGCPNVLAEALYCGMHIVATDCPGGVREVLQDGALGILVPVRNPTLLAEALIKALDEPSKITRFECPEGFEAASSVTRYLAVLAGAEDEVTATALAGGNGHDIEATA